MLSILPLQFDRSVAMSKIIHFKVTASVGPPRSPFRIYTPSLWRSIGVHNWSDFEIYEGHSPLIQLSQLNIHILNYLLILTNGIQIAIKIVGKCERSAPEFQLTEKVSKLIEWFARFLRQLDKVFGTKFLWRIICQIGDYNFILFWKYFIY